MNTHAFVYLSVGFAISLGLNVVLFVLLRRYSCAFQRMKSVFRAYRGFHVRRIRSSRVSHSTLFGSAQDTIKGLEEKNRALEETLERRGGERSYFLAQWKIFAPLAAKLEVLSEYWESETHYWRKKCWWLSDRIAQEKDRQVIYAAMKAAAGAAHAATGPGLGT
jgi:hypothetical protein